MRPPERFVAQVDADHGAARGVIAHEPRHDAGAAAHIDDDLPRPRRLPDGATEEARIELERGVKRRLEGVREAIVVPPRDRRDVAHGHRRTTRGRRLSRRADRLARHGAVHDLHEAARTPSASRRREPRGGVRALADGVLAAASPSAALAGCLLFARRVY